MLGLGVMNTGFGATGISRCFGTTCRAQRSIQDRHTSILAPFDRYAFLLFRVKFDDGSSISVSKNKASRLENLQLEIVKVRKKSNVVKGPAHPLFSGEF
jgi:hypothetical protein